jgi:hypothetical protein
MFGKDATEVATDLKRTEKTSCVLHENPLAKHAMQFILWEITETEFNLKFGDLFSEKIIN